MSRIEVLQTPPLSQEEVTIEHTNEVMLLDRELYSGELPLREFGVSTETIATFQTVIPAPRANTYVLNLQRAEVRSGILELKTNFTTMRSQFALRRWIKEVDSHSDLYQTILNNIRPIGSQMATKTLDNYILMEERGRVENPGTYAVAPAGGVETRNWRLRPDPFIAIQGEAWEETGMLPRADYNQPLLLGIARDYQDGFNPTFCFYAESKLTLPELILKADSIAPEAGEHLRLFGLPLDSDEIIRFYLEKKGRTSGQGYSPVLLYADVAFSKGNGAWLKGAARELNAKGCEITLFQDRFS